MAHHVVTNFGALVVESLCDLECALRTARPLYDSQLAPDAVACFSLRSENESAARAESRRAYLITPIVLVTLNQLD